MIRAAESLLITNYAPTHVELMNTACPILTATTAGFPPSRHNFSILAGFALLDKGTIMTRLSLDHKQRLRAFLMPGAQLYTAPRAQQPLHELLAELDGIAREAFLRALRAPPHTTSATLATPVTPATHATPTTHATPITPTTPTTHTTHTAPPAPVACGDEFDLLLSVDVLPESPCGPAAVARGALSPVDKHVSHFRLPKC